MYTHIHVLGQLVVAANQHENLDKYLPAKNDQRLAVCLYDTSTGKFEGIAMRLAFIILRGDDEETIFSHGCLEKKSLILYSVAREKVPNAFIFTSFKKHFH